MRSPICLLAILLTLAPALAQNSESTSANGDKQKSGTSPTGDSTDGKNSGEQDPPQKQLTEAERITRLERTIQETEKLLAELNDKLEKQKTDPEAEYFKAQKDFEELDKEKEDLTTRKESATGSAAEEIDSALKDLQERWQLARDRFDLALQDRKAIEEQKAAIETKLQQDKAALQKLLAPPATQPATTTAPAPAATDGGQTPAPAPGAPGATAAPAAPGTPMAAVQSGAEPVTPESKAGEEEAPSEEEIKATQELKEKEVKTQQAEEEVRSVADRIASAQKTIEAQEKQLETAKKRADVARETERVLNEQIKKLTAEGGKQAEIQELRTRVQDARKSLSTAQEEAAKLSDQLDVFRQHLKTLEAEQADAQAKADESRKEEEEAKEQLEKIQNPFSIQNMTIWITAHGPPLLAIIIGVFLALWLVRFADKRIVAILAGKSDQGSKVERENRAKTIVNVFHNFSTIVIYVGGLLMVLAEVGIPIAPLLGGAAVFGLAIAFGAQNLVRDYFSGFMILLENQYGINDVVKIAGISGLVESVTLRVTVLRDLEGTAHFIPNGQITTVSNMTHGWSRALFEIGVAYKEDVDKVMEILVNLGKELREDPEFKWKILDDPEMLGVDAFGDSAIVIKFFIKTRPLQQWPVKRQLLRRIKKKFDELGIEIPFPHRTIYHRTEEDFTPRIHFDEPVPVTRSEGSEDA